MSGKKKKRRKRKMPKVRDPFWRLRRLFGQRKKDSAKGYKRTESRKAEQDARSSPD